jgi:hypothetical protein
VFRGGCWVFNGYSCRAAYGKIESKAFPPTDRGPASIGFRLARVPSGKEKAKR